MLFKFSLVMVFLIHVFIEVIFEKLFSHEAPVTGKVTATCSNQTQLFKQLQMKKNCSSHVGSFDSIRNEFFAKVISRFKSFSLRDIYEL